VIIVPVGLRQPGQVEERTAIENRRRAPVGVSVLDPLLDLRWSEFVNRHPHASVFHSTGWLETLRRTYGYEPLVVTTSGKNEPLSNGIVVCRVRSWLTGPRLVSLPFSDHCDPLVDDTHDLEELISFLKAEVKLGRYSYLEMRPLRAMNSDALQSMDLKKDETRCIHHLDMRPTLDELYHKFHKKSVQSVIRKMEREQLLYQEGRSEELFSKF